MAAAGWLIRDSLGNGQVMTVPIEVSGAQGIVFCKIRGLETGFEGTVDMPQVLGISRQNVSGTDVTEVRMEGITHLIRESCEPIGKEEAETLLMAYAERSQDPAAGLLDRNPETGFVRPLVYVRGSGTLVWENACGSGAAAVGALEAWRQESGTVRTEVPQPGGKLLAEAAAEQGTVREVRITGMVRIEAEKEM